MKIIQNSLLLLLLLAFALAGHMETSQADKGISSIQAAPGTTERFINLIPNGSKEAIQVPSETVKKFRFLTGEMLQDDDKEKSEIPLTEINSRTLELIIEYANIETFLESPLDHLRHLLYNIVKLLLAITSFCSMKY